MTNLTKSENIKWHHGSVTGEKRAESLGQKGGVIWFTGLSGSGKSTLATRLEAELIAQKKFAYVLDGDNIRFGLNSNLGFSPEDRKENIRRVAEVARLFCDAGVILITAFISPYRADRDFARSLVPTGQFFEIHCAATVDECEKRDPKGLYKKAREGIVKEFTGISSPYEEPKNPELVLQTGKEKSAESLKKVLEFLRKEKIV